MTKILLVEDDNNLREIFEMRLQAEGYQTVTAADGEEGLTVAVKEKPDLVIADVMMPKLSGFEMVENLKAAPEMKDTKIVMMTALGQTEDRTRGEKLGVVKYLVKSQVTLEDFARVVNEVMGKQITPAPSATPENDSSTNKQESENNMQEDPTTPTDPSTPAPDSGTAQASNPISDTPPTDGSVGSEQQTTAQEQSAVTDQVNSFVANAPSEPAAPAADPAAPAPDEPAAPAAPDGPYVPPATPPAPTEGESGEEAPAAPAQDPGTTPPADPMSSSI